MPVAGSRSPVSISWLIFAGVCAPFGFNIVAALLPAIQAQFVLDHAGMQWMVSAYALTMGCGQLVGGPLADTFGRRRILLSGMGIFVLGSVAAALAQSYPQLLVFRVVQGLGACVTLVIPRAVVRDRHMGPEAARAMALIMISLSVTPALAPVVGGLMQTWFGWRAGFLACAVVGLILLGFAWRLHGETLPPSRRVPLAFGGVLRSYAGLLANWRFCAYALSYSLLNCSFIGFFVIGPGFLTARFGMTPVGVSLTLLAAYLGFGAGNLLAAHHVKRVGVDRMLAWGLFFALVGTLLLLVVARAPVLGWILLAISLQSLGTGLSFPSGIAGATAVYPERAGTASALVGAIQMGTAAAFAVLSGIVDDGSLMPLAWSCLAACAISGACIWPLWRRRAPTGSRFARHPSADRAGRP